jgi:hypothetical protein
VEEGERSGNDIAVGWDARKSFDRRSSILLLLAAVAVAAAS